MLTLAKLNGQPEIFYSLQGEGRNTGKPSVFVRLANCNLHCVWCDTDYTWNWKGTRFAHQFDSNPSYEKYDRATWTLDMDIVEVVDRVSAYPCRHLVITGGEPLLQDQAVADLMRSLRKQDPSWTFAVETNGTIIPCAEFQELIDQYNVSPKLENSNNSQKLREKPEAYKYFATRKNAWFKFVIENPEDLKEVVELVRRYEIPSSRVYLMPEGLVSEELRQKQFWLVEKCKEHGFMFTDRLHIRLYGSKKGV